MKLDLRDDDWFKLMQSDPARFVDQYCPHLYRVVATSLALGVDSLWWLWAQGPTSERGTAGCGDPGRRTLRTPVRWLADHGQADGLRGDPTGPDTSASHSRRGRGRPWRPARLRFGLNRRALQRPLAGDRRVAARCWHRQAPATPVLGRRHQARRSAGTREALGERDHGHVDPSQITVGEWLTLWLEWRTVDQAIGPRVVENYRTIVRLHLAPAIGRLRL